MSYLALIQALGVTLIVGIWGVTVFLMHEAERGQRARERVVGRAGADLDRHPPRGRA